MVKNTSCISIIYSRYMLHGYSYYLFPLPVTRVFLLHIFDIYYTDIHVTDSSSLHDTYPHTHTHTHYCSTHHLENVSCIPNTGSCYTKSHGHLSDHIHIHPTVMQSLGDVETYN